MAAYKIQHRYITQKIGKKTVIFDSDKSVMYTLNETAEYIFHQLKLGMGQTEILQAARAKYNVDKKTIKKDIADLVDDLLKKEIISVIKTKK